MFRKRIIISGILLFSISVSYLIINTNSNNKYVKEKSSYNNVKSKEDIEKEKIYILELDDDLLKAKNQVESNEYPNLFGETVRIYEGAEEAVSKLRLLDVKEEDFLSFEEQMNIIENNIPNINYEYVVDMYTEKSYEEVKKQIEEGTYKNERNKEKGLDKYPGMCYVPEKYTDGYAMICPHKSGTCFEKGKYYSLRETYSEKMGDLRELVDTYYFNGDNLDDVYQLANGSMSVKEGIEFVENYIKNELPYDTEPAFNLKVKIVQVFLLNDNIHCFRLEMSREYQGIYFESGSRLGKDDGNYLNETNCVYMVETDDIDMYGPEENANGVEEIGDGYDKILPATSAVNIVAGHIGQSSSYNISSIELIYRRELKNGGKDCEAELYWKISGINSNDDSEVYFYVNVFDGKISVESSIVF
ncbi:MAG: hypothetical protein IJA34_08495 [Lachnospiraceae bacterium]|nr:hypothetical protein [Lachnospiraceae bacterium]